MAGQAGKSEEVEIEVTPEMINAGTSALLDFHSDYERYESAAERIFYTMIDTY
jgi:hypothetical protein